MYLKFKLYDYCVSFKNLHSIFIVVGGIIVRFMLILLEIDNLLSSFISKNTNRGFRAWHSFLAHFFHITTSLVATFLFQLRESFNFIWILEKLSDANRYKVFQDSLICHFLCTAVCHYPSCPENNNEQGYSPNQLLLIKKGGNHFFNHFSLLL